MRVLVTGASGFVGSHAVPALLGAGHDVVALARTPSRVRTALAAHDVSVEVVEGDMTDARSVDRGLDGCDAVIHAAAQIGVSGGTEFSPEVNVDGVRHVIGRAVERGCDPIVHTSTFTVHLPTDHDVIGPDAPFATPGSAYGRSKLACEELIAGWQADGAPIVTVVLGGVYGPVSPHLDGSAGSLVTALTAMTVDVDGGVPIVDVRDVARLLAALVAPDGGPRRLMAGGHYVTWRDFAELLGRVVGRDLPLLEIEPDALIEMGRDLDRARGRGEAVDVPLTEDAGVIMTAGRPTDDSATWAPSGVERRPTEETLRDAVTWLVEAGHLDRSAAPAI